MVSNSEIKTFVVCEDEVVTSETSSKGNQIKYRKDAVWIKQDCLGYEGLAEVVASRLAKLLGLDCVSYKPCRIHVLETGENKLGCYSENFIPQGSFEITLQRLVQKCTGGSCDELLEGCNTNVYDKVNKIAEAIKNVIDKPTLTDYIGRLLYFDSLIVNEDRHWHNITFLRDCDGKVRPAPVFDNGASFFSDSSRDYPFELEFCYEKVKAKPFSTSFEAQAAAAHKLMKTPICTLTFATIDYSDLEEVYDREAIARVKAVIRRAV